jgi:ElaB/YqjD/DUF883 family membrane-anchored ribosome-binding protein
MAQDRNLPEGTDKIIPGASQTSGGTGGGTGGKTGGGGSGGTEQVVITEKTTIVAEMDVPDRGGSGSGGSGSRGGGSSGGSPGSGSSGSIKDKVREGSQKLTGQAADKGRDYVNQGLERSSDALSNVSRLVGETASGLDERLGSEYGDYARRAADAIDSTAQKLRSKDPDELIDDTRDFVRKSPGVALAGAAIVGFALARLVKTSLQGVGGQQSDRDRSRARQSPGEEFGGQQFGGSQSQSSPGARGPGGTQPGTRSPTGGQPGNRPPTGGQPGGTGQGGPRGGAF